MHALARDIDRPLILVNEAALALDPALIGAQEAATVVVAGASRARLALAHVIFPGAEVVWTDFGLSASVRSLLARIEARGGLDRLVLAGAQDAPEPAETHLSAILTLLPALRRRQGAEVVLSFPEGPALRSLRTFLRRLAPELRRDGLSVIWHDPARPAADAIA